MCIHAPDQVQITPRLHSNLRTVLPLHHYRCQQLPAVLRSMLLFFQGTYSVISFYELMRG